MQVKQVIAESDSSGMLKILSRIALNLEPLLASELTRSVPRSDIQIFVGRPLVTQIDMSAGQDTIERGSTICAIEIFFSRIENMDYFICLGKIRALAKVVEDDYSMLGISTYIEQYEQTAVREFGLQLDLIHRVRK